jgi:hypothetical protein
MKIILWVNVLYWENPLTVASELVELVKTLKTQIDDDHDSNIPREVRLISVQLEEERDETLK